MIASYLKMSYHPCISGSGRLLAPQDGNYHCFTCLDIKHTEEAFVDGSCSSCGDMIISELHSRLRYVKHGGVSLPLPCPVESEGIWGSQWGLPQEEFLTPQAIAIGAGWDLCRTGYTTCFLWCSPWRSVYGRVPNCVGLSIAGSTPCLEPPQRAPSEQGQSGPYGQYCNRCVYQPARRFTLPSYVATRPPPPHQESEASEVPSCHPHPWSVQSGSRRASTSRGVKISSPGGSADLGMVRSWSGGPVCISRYHPLQVVLLTNRGNARHGCTGTQLAPGPAQICIYPSEPNGTDNVQDQGGWGAGLVSGSILARQDLVPGTHDSPFLADSFEEGFAFFPARLCTQGSYHSLQGPGSELASAAPGGGRPSHCFTLSCMHTVTVYMDRTQSFRTSEQLFVCYEGQQKGEAVSKQRMAHWIVDAITLAYEAQGVPCPLSMPAHSTPHIVLGIGSWCIASRNL